MNEKTIKNLFEQFLDTYDSKQSSETWKNQSRIFREFWEEKILDDNYRLNIPDDLIPIIQILDVKGARKNESEERFEGVAYTNVFQTTWYEIFDELKKDKKKKRLIDNILRSENDSDLISFIDRLHELNKVDRIPALTGNRGIVINVLLFAHNPIENISMVSLADRYKLIDFFNLGKSTEIERKSYGYKLVKTKNLVISFKDRFDQEIDNRGMCLFFYFDPMRKIWKTEGGHGIAASEEISLLFNKKQIILYGPPGTGKTYKTKSISIELIEND